MTEPAATERLERALFAFLQEFTDEHEMTVASVVGTLHVVAYEVLRANDERDKRMDGLFPELN